MKHTVTNIFGETATIDWIDNPMYGNKGGYGCGSLSVPKIPSVSFKGLTGKSLVYVQNANIYAFDSLYNTASIMIDDPEISFELALTNVLLNKKL